MRPVGKGPTPFGVAVKRKRDERGWSQPDLAAASGLSVGYIGGIEAGLRGRNPSRSTVLAIARAFGENPHELLVLTGKVQEGDDAKARPTRPTFESFVTGDPLLRADERDMLIRLYRSYTGGRGRR